MVINGKNLPGLLEYEIVVVEGAEYRIDVSKSPFTTYNGLLASIHEVGRWGFQDEFDKSKYWSSCAVITADGEEYRQYKAYPPVLRNKAVEMIAQVAQR